MEIRQHGRHQGLRPARQERERAVHLSGRAELSGRDPDRFSGLDARRHHPRRRGGRRDAQRAAVYDHRARRALHLRRHHRGAGAGHGEPAAPAARGGGAAEPRARKDAERPPAAKHEPHRRPLFHHQSGHRPLPLPRAAEQRAALSGLRAVFGHGRDHLQALLPRSLLRSACVYS